jgi:hypothetical protein
MAWANFAPVGSVVVLAALLRQRERGELGRLGRELALAYGLPVAPFAAAYLATAPGSWLRLAASALAGALALGFAARRHAAEWRAFLAGAPQ